MDEMPIMLFNFSLSFSILFLPLFIAPLIVFLISPPVYLFLFHFYLSHTHQICRASSPTSSPSLPHLPYRTHPPHLPHRVHIPTASTSLSYYRTLSWPPAQDWPPSAENSVSALTVVECVVTSHCYPRAQRSSPYCPAGWNQVKLVFFAPPPPMRL